jgi:hypothetical protein
LPLRSSRWAAPRITFMASGARRRSIPRGRYRRAGSAAVRIPRNYWLP